MFHCDHRVPLHQGGVNHLSNMQALCAACHWQKTTNEFMLLMEQRQTRSFAVVRNLLKHKVMDRVVWLWVEWDNGKRSWETLDHVRVCMLDAADQVSSNVPQVKSRKRYKLDPHSDNK